MMPCEKEKYENCVDCPDETDCITKELGQMYFCPFWKPSVAIIVSASSTSLESEVKENE